MPRVQTLLFTKDYKAVADGLATMLTNVTTTHREEDGRDMIDLEGDFSHFILEDMEMWELHLKFEVKDNRVGDEDDREVRAILASGMPGFGSVLFSPTIAFVYRPVRTKTVTTTIVEQVRENERLETSVTEVSREVQGSEWVTEWEDITGEFGRKVRIDR